MFRRESVEGLNALTRDINRLPTMPTKCINKGVRRGANVILHEARRIASQRKITGKMSKKLTLKTERSRTRGKRVMQVTYPKASKYPEAVKITADGTRYFYPASQNFGFKTRDGDYVDGLNFMTKAMESKTNEASKTIVTEITKEIDKMLREGNG